MKGDYAANAGDAITGAGYDFSPNIFAIPQASDYPANIDSFKWTPTNDPKTAFYQTGVIYIRSEISGRRITDGRSNTYLIGEKFLTPLMYESAEGTRRGYGDDEVPTLAMSGTTAAGRTIQTAALIAKLFNPGKIYLAPTIRTSMRSAARTPRAMNMSMCDGSVHSLSYDIDSDVHRYLANRLDGETATMP